MLSRTLLAHARRPLLSPPAPQLRAMSSSPTPTLGNPLDVNAYQAGRDSALKWAKENGYSDECMVEVQVAWGEQGEPGTRFFRGRERDTAEPRSLAS